MYAAIDVGSNTVRLLIGSIESGRVMPILYRRRITRLSGGLSSEHGLDAAARRRTLAALREFSAVCRANSVRAVRAAGTAALREAVDGARFAGEVERATGLPLEIISGDQEAQLTADGVLAALEPRPDLGLIVDIGGGSTEFILIRSGETVWSISQPLGVVRLVEECPGSREQQDYIETALDAVLVELQKVLAAKAPGSADLKVVGTAGTATTLAALDLGMEDYDWRRVNNYRLSTGRIATLQEQLRPLTPEQRERLPGLEAGRGDLIVAGIDILWQLLSRLERKELIISDFGLLEGLLGSLAVAD